MCSPLAVAFAFAFSGVRHQQNQQRLTDHSECLPTHLTVLESILTRHGSWVVKHKLGQLERHAVLFLIASILVRIERKTHISS